MDKVICSSVPTCILLFGAGLACVQAHGGEGIVLAAFTHERSILIGCLLLDTIIRTFSRWIQTIYLLRRLVISLKLNLVTFLYQKMGKNRLFILMCRYI